MIQIITHAYAMDLPQYAVFLRIQLSSLCMWRPNVPVKVGICYHPKDGNVLEVLDDFAQFVDIEEMPLPKESLFRRSIGRNHFALRTKADLIWFADADYYWGKDCLDSLYEMWKNSASWAALTYPKRIMIPALHEESDVFWQSCLKSRGQIAVDVQDIRFTTKRYYKAIGGAQIVRGDYARKYGYINGWRRYQSPVDPSKPFPSFVDDVKFRRLCEKNDRQEGIFLDGVYRLRHTATTYKL